MTLHLQCTITLLHPYNGNILGIFLDASVICPIQFECAKAQQRDPRRPRHLRRIRRSSWTRCQVLYETRVTKSSPLSVFLIVEQRRWNTSAIAPGVSFSVPGALSSLPDPKTREDGSPYAGCRRRLALDSLSSRTSGDLTKVVTPTRP